MLDPQKTAKELNIVVNLPPILSKQVFYGRSRGSCTADNHEDLNMAPYNGIWILRPRN